MLRFRDIEIFLPSLLILFLLLTSCIKEDRKDCPSVLILDLSAIRKEVKWVNLWVYDSADMVIRHEHIERSNFSKRYEVEIPRRETKIFIWGNIGDSTKITGFNSKSEIISNNGVTMDSLYFFSSMIYPNGEYYYQWVKMNREFLKIYINVLSQLTDGGELQVVLHGKTIGYTIQREAVKGELSLLKNPFERYKENGKWNRFSYIIPRQREISSLSVSLISHQSNENKLIGRINIGEIIADLINENTIELFDITVVIDYSALRFLINIGKWSYEAPLEVVI